MRKFEKKFLTDVLGAAVDESLVCVPLHIVGCSRPEKKSNLNFVKKFLFF